jgi:histidine triad (HIT) family protein
VVTTDPTCLFCRIVSGEIPATRVHEDEHCIAFRDLSPQAPVHVLIIPRAHYASLDAAAPEHEAALGHALRMASTVAAKEGLSGGYRTVINTGPDANQTVQHLHIHVLGGRTLGWPPG